MALQAICSSVHLPAAQQQNALLFRAVELLFRFPPFFAFAAAKVTILANMHQLHQFLQHRMHVTYFARCVLRMMRCIPSCRHAAR